MWMKLCVLSNLVFVHFHCETNFLSTLNYYIIIPKTKVKFFQVYRFAYFLVWFCFLLKCMQTERILLRNSLAASSLSFVVLRNSLLFRFVILLSKVILTLTFFVKYFYDKLSSPKCISSIRFICTILIYKSENCRLFKIKCSLVVLPSWRAYA